MLLLDTGKASAGYGIGGGGMFRKRTKPINQKRLFIRVYVSVMTLILAASVVALLSQNVKVRACENVTDSITVHYRGQTMKTSGNGETAGELLDRLGLELSGEDMVSCGLDTVTYDGMVITVDRVVTRQERTAAAIPHGIQRCTDETLPEGTEQVLLENIQQFRKNRTCIITTHRPTVLSICQRAYLIENRAVALMGEEQLKQMMKEF